jgi:dTDP-4-dehydrorhamnose reductase
MRALEPIGKVIAVGREHIDLTQPDTIRSEIQRVSPDVIVNAAAYTAVDRAEKELALAELVNATAPGILAEEAKRSGAWLVHYSTDYVFDGLQCRPYSEDDLPHPINAYGQTKLDGERRIQQVGGSYLILRTSWVYSNRRSNFLKTMLQLAQERTQLQVIDDQIGTPTWAGWIAESTSHILHHVLQHPVPSIRQGLYHLSSDGETSWYGFAKAIFESFEMPRIELIPISSETYGAAAQRPPYSVLSNCRTAQAFNLPIPNWREQLQVARVQMLDPRTL